MDDRLAPSGGNIPVAARGARQASSTEEILTGEPLANSWLLAADLGLILSLLDANPFIQTFSEVS